MTGRLLPASAWLLRAGHHLIHNGPRDNYVLDPQRFRADYTEIVNCRCDGDAYDAGDNIHDSDMKDGSDAGVSDGQATKDEAKSYRKKYGLQLPGRGSKSA